MEKSKLQQAGKLQQIRVNNLQAFHDIAHRMQTVAIINNVEWINDSKATDTDTSYLSLEMIGKPVVWIIGSSDTHQNYEVFDKLVKYKVKSIICFGKPETVIKYRFATWVDAYAHKATLEEAVACAAEWSKPGDAVLFSPATSGFDDFGDFRERGKTFENLVKQRA